MKKTLFILSLFVGLCVSAQSVDSTQLPISITLTQGEFKYIIGCVGVSNFSSTPERFKYLKTFSAQFVKGQDSVNRTATVTAGMVRDFTVACSQKPEGQATNYNNRIFPKVYGQIVESGNTWLKSAVENIREVNWNITEQMIQDVEDYLLKLQQ